MRACVQTLVFLVVISQLSSARQEGSATSSQPPVSTIPAGEAHFTPEQLKEYYLVYKNPDVLYLRELFGAYLRGASGKEEEFNLLKKWDSEYYKSKFVVISRDKGTFGGTFITFIFQDRQDKVFVAWVYPDGSEQKLTLRALDPGKFNEEDLRRIRLRYKTLLNDKDHAM